MKDRVIKWAIKQIVNDGEGNYAQMRYLEDVVMNQFGEKQFIFAHRFVRPDPTVYNRASNEQRFSGVDTMSNQESKEHEEAA